MFRVALAFVLVSCLISSCKKDNSEHDFQSKNVAGKSVPLKGALVLSRFNSLQDFKEVVSVEYGKSSVYLTHKDGGNEVVSELRTGVAENDFVKARDGSIWDKIRLGVRSPYVVFNRADLIRVEILGRRRHMMFGEGDVAFYDLAEQTVSNIRYEDRRLLTEQDLSEKGYLNTFNHITAQALITSLYSERVADFISDVHERQTMPELITGDFTHEQLADFDNGPVDNYLDMVNNEWGQELGKELKRKFNIRSTTVWTPLLLSDYLNEVQNYYAFTLGISFLPFDPSSELLIRFSEKINLLNSNVNDLVAEYY